MVASYHFRLAIVLALLSMCIATDQTESVDTNPAQVPPGREKLSDMNREDTLSGINEPPLVETMIEDKQLQADDDDYSVVVLDDAIPWDLTADTPDVLDVPVPNRTRPTMAPTAAVPDIDDDDYVVIILEDDVPWDDVAVAEYVKDEFEAINNANSNSSDYDDDGFEDDSPKMYPSPAPSVAVVPAVSYKPNSGNAVTVAPTTTKPTFLPTDYPSFLPTISPSEEPTASPTLSCHDKDTYRSPINDLTCQQHKSTDCLDWRHVGLNMNELESLVTNCPITCNIECGSFHLFSAPVSFQISRVAGFMNPKDVDALMSFSVDFLEGFVRRFIFQNAAKNARFNRDGNTNPNENTNPEGEDLSGSNDIDNISEKESPETDEDDFFNGDTVNGGGIMFEIEMAELTAQNLVEENPSLTGRVDASSGEEISSYGGNDRRLRSRSLQDLQRTKQKSSGGKSIIRIDETLDVIITFKGFTIGMNPDKMSELLASGIQGVDFTRELQQSRIDFFSEASVSSATEKAEEDFIIEEDIIEEDTKRNSKFSVLISYLVPIVVIGFALGSLFYHKCYVKGKWSRRHNINRQNAIERAQIGGMVASPRADTSTDVIVTSDSNEEGSTGYFNFLRLASTSLNTVAENEDDGTKSTKTADNEKVSKLEGVQSVFTRFVTALNLNLTLTRSKNSTDEEEANEADGASSTSKRSGDTFGEMVQSGNVPIIPDDLVSPISGDSGRDEGISTEGPKFKPYSSVLPPMIVIDNIEGPDAGAIAPVIMENGSTAVSSNGLQDASIRTSHRPLDDLDAFASEYRKQLAHTSGTATHPRHPSYTGSFYSMGSSALDSGSNQGSLVGPNSEVDDYPVIDGIVSDEWDGDDLFSPIPCNITTNDGEESISNSHNKNETDGPSAITKPQVWDGNKSSLQVPTNPEKKLLSSTIPMIFQRTKKTDGTLSKRRSTLPPKCPSTPERLRVGSDQHHRRSSFSKIPSIPQTSTGGSSISSGWEGHRRKSSLDTALELPKNSSSISALSTDELTINVSKSDSSNNNTTSRLEFEAPRKGNWGLVLESTSKTGPRIYAVKDYSPLFGLVEKGDKLLEIDGKNVSQSKLTEVTKLLKGKSSPYPYHRPASSTMPIVVSRGPSYTIDSSIGLGNSRDYNSGISSMHSNKSEFHHRRTDSYGSYGSAGSVGSRVVEDVDDDNNAIGVYYLDHLQNHPQQNSSFEYDSRNEI